MRKSIGFADRLGVAAAGQVAVAANHPGFAPFFAQCSPREWTEIGRTPQDALALAARAVGNARHRAPWGADADLLRTPQEVDEAAAAGFTYFTIDLSEHVRADANSLPPDALAATVETLIAEGELPDDWAAPYLGRTVELAGRDGLRLGIDALRLAAVKYGRAIQHGARMYETAARANRGRPFEIEISLEQSASPVTTTEHLFIGLELEARGVRLTGLALRLDDREPAAFDEAMGVHVAVASFCGPYKLSFRSGTHDPAVIPVIGRRCGDLLHFKTAAESELEALRLAWRLEPDLFLEIIAAGGLSTEAGGDDPEARYFDGPHGQSQLAPVLGAIFAGAQNRDGRSLKVVLVELLEQRADIYQELLTDRYGRLMQTLNAG